MWERIELSESDGDSCRSSSSGCVGGGCASCSADANEATVVQEWDGDHSSRLGEEERQEQQGRQQGDFAKSSRSSGGSSGRTDLCSTENRRCGMGAVATVKRAAVAEGAEVDGVAEGAEVDGVAEGAEVDGVAEGAEVDGVAEGAEVDGVAEGAVMQGQTHDVGCKGKGLDAPRGSAWLGILPSERDLCSQMEFLESFYLLL
ncbi:unnamed protein product [Closterium sp. NIES-54]